MPANYTPNYQLNQWERSDKVLMDDFNHDNARIDSALAAKADASAVEALDRAVGGKAERSALEMHFGRALSNRVRPGSHPGEPHQHHRRTGELHDRLPHILRHRRDLHARL